MPIRPGAPGSGQTRPAPDSSYTTAIRDGGIAALDEARRNKRWGTQAMAAGAPYSTPPVQSNDLYDQWLSQMTPQDYPVTLGRGDGKYAGFETQGMLQAALQGYAETGFDEAQARAAALEQLANEGLDRATVDYQTRNSEANQRDWGSQFIDRVTTPSTAPRARETGWSGGTNMYEVNPGEQTGSAPAAPVKPPATGSRQASLTPEMKAREYGDYARKSYVANELEPWLADTTAPLLEQQDLAQQIAGTPISVYGEAAGAAYGVDPYVVRGWYDDKNDLSHWGTRRDLDSIAATGMPYSDYEQALNAMEAEQRTAAEQAQKDAETQATAEQDAQAQQIEQYVTEATNGLSDATSLATTLDVAPLDVVDIVGSDAYQGYQAEIADALSTQDPTAVQDAVTSVFGAAYYQDPALYDVLRAVYGDRFPNEWTNPTVDLAV